MDININETIDRISYFRNKNRLSARELSLLIGKSENYINRLESSRFNLSVETLYEIIYALDVSREQFFSNNYMTHNDDVALFNKFRSLKENDKDIVLKMVESLNNK